MQRPRDLLATLKREKLVLDWKKQQMWAAVPLVIRDVLDKDLARAYDPSQYERKCGEEYKHVYEHCPTDVYAA